MTMKAFIALLSVLFLGQAFAGDTPPTSKPPSDPPIKVEHRYLIERTFPAGALDGLDAAGKAKINATNAQFGVHWVTSYANANKPKTYCIYNAPSETAVRDAAKANGIPVDSIAEVPVTLSPK
jgi:hypothetical protein